jgi:hypothetical protein
LKGKLQCVLIKQESFLIFSRTDPNLIKGISLSPQQQLTRDGTQEAIVPITNIGWPVMIDYNVQKQLIYFAHKEE